VASEDTARLEIPSHLVAFVLAQLACLSPLLRPSARKDLRRFVGAMRRDDLDEFMRWADRVLQAHRVDGKHLGGMRAAEAVRQTSLPIFRRPERAYRPRPIH